MSFLQNFIEDCRYYDIESLELKTVFKNVELKGKTILDIGAGIGRLSFPLSRYAKEVIALDKDRRFLDYFKKKKNKRVKFVNEDAKTYLKKNKKFEVILLAWPTFDFEFIRLIKKSMNGEGIFIFITCDNNSDYETILDKLENKKDFKNAKNKLKFLKKLEKNFKLLAKKNINTAYTYPSEKIAFRAIKNSMKLWFKMKFNSEKESRLRKIIKQHSKRNKIIFKERIYFYVLKR